MSDVTAAPGLSAPDDEALRRRTSWTVIGVAGAMAVIAFVLVCVFVALPLFMLALGGSGDSQAGNRIADMPDRPEQEWQYQYADVSQDYLAGPPRLVPVGSNAMLSVPVYDYRAWQQENVEGDWYPEVGDHYSVGYSAGQDFLQAEAEFEMQAVEWEQKYQDAYAAWEQAHEQRLEDYRAGDGEYPEWDWDSSMIEGEPPLAPGRSDFLQGDWIAAGYSVGFDDATQGRAQGESLPEPPPNPPWDPTATLVDMKTGKEQWTLSFADAVDGLYYAPPTHSLWVPDADVLVFRVPLAYQGQQPRYQLLAVSPSNGEVMSTSTIEARVELESSGADLIVVESTYHPETGERIPGDLYAINPKELDGDPKWSNSDINVQSVRVVGDYLFAQSTRDGESVVLDAASGEELSWGHDMFVDEEQSGGVFYEPVSDNTFVRIQATNVEFGSTGLLAGSGVHARIANSSGSIELAGTDANGEDMWNASVQTSTVFLAPGQLYVGELDPSTGLVGDLMRLDPSSGEPMWETASEQTYIGVLMVASDVLLALDESGASVVALDTATGAQLYGEPVTSDNLWTHQWVSDNYYYFATQEGQLLAHFIQEPGWVWSTSFDAQVEGVRHIGQRLAVVNVDTRTVSLLG